MNLDTQQRVFDSRIKEMRSMIFRKAADYANDNDQLSNFKLAGEIAGMTAEMNCLSLIATKVARLGALLNSPTEPNNESVDDSLLDLGNYSVLLHMIRKDSALGKPKAANDPGITENVYGCTSGVGAFKKGAKEVLVCPVVSDADLDDTWNANDPTSYYTNLGLQKRAAEALDPAESPITEEEIANYARLKNMLGESEQFYGARSVRRDAIKQAYEATLTLAPHIGGVSYSKAIDPTYMNGPAASAKNVFRPKKFVYPADPRFQLENVDPSAEAKYKAAQDVQMQQHERLSSYLRGDLPKDLDAGPFEG